MTINPLKIANDLLCCQSAKEVRDYVARHDFEIWQLPTSNLLNIQLHSIVAICDFGGNLNLCLDRIEELMVAAN